MAHIHQARNDLELKLEQAKAQRKQKYQIHNEQSRKSDKRWTIAFAILLAVCIIGFIWLVRDIEIGLAVRYWVQSKLEIATEYLVAVQWGGDWLENAFGRGFFTVIFDIIIWLILWIPKILLIVLGIVGAIVMPSVARITLYVLPLILGVFSVLAIIVLMSGYEYTGSESDEEQIIRAGLEGEQSALRLMKKLGNDCHVYTNLRIPYDGGESETDLIVVSPAGVTVIEVKNYKGTITGDASDDSLTQIKGRQGDSKTVQNPIRQVGTHVYRLAGYLRSKGIRTYVRNCVLFVNENAVVDLQDRQGALDKCPVFTVTTIKALYAYVSAGETVLNSTYLQRTVDTLNALVDSSFSGEAPAPQPAPSRPEPRHESARTTPAPASTPRYQPAPKPVTPPAPEPALPARSQPGDNSDAYPIRGTDENNMESRFV